jgi:dTDP-4-dehydrorhamnose reductase
VTPRLLILGSTGQLGHELIKTLPPEMVPVALSRQDIDLTSEDALRKALREFNPEVIVNAAAYTAVDRAERESEVAYAVNAAAPQIMAEEALRSDAWLLHFSTDYVFDGAQKQAWKETDAPNPLNIYGKSKLKGEQAIATVGCRHLIFRTSWVYAAHGQNFLRTMLRLATERSELRIVDDQYGAPTSAGELARAIRNVLTKLLDPAGEELESGIYHMTCTGSTSWHGFAQAIFAGRNAGMPAPELIPIPSEQYPTPAVRPRNSVLNCDKLKSKMGVRLISWQDALTEVMAELEGRVL